MSRHRVQLFAGASLLLLAACSSEPASGPGTVVWDRDTCEHCSMAIGDRHFAAQVRDAGDRRLRRFDDLGCALLWLDEREASTGGARNGERPEIWVRDPAGERWIDGYTARFADGFNTPMGYGFATVPGGGGETLDLAQVRARLHRRQAERRRVDR